MRCFSRNQRSTSHGALHIKAVGEIAVEHRTEAQFQHEQGMLDQKGAQLATVLVAFLDLDEQGFDVGAFGMRAFAGTRGNRHGIGKHLPVDEGEQGAVALHDGIMFHQQGQGALVKETRVW